MQTTELDFNCLFNNFQPLPKYLSELFKCTPAKPIAALGLALSFKFICERVCLEFVIFTPISEAVLWVKLNFHHKRPKNCNLLPAENGTKSHVHNQCKPHTHTVSVSRISILWIKWYVASGRESSEMHTPEAGDQTKSKGERKSRIQNNSKARAEAEADQEKKQ